MNTPTADQAPKSAGPVALKVSWKLGLGILFLPFIFSWVTLKNGYSKNARIASFGWLALFVIMQLSNRKEFNDYKGAQQTRAVAAVAAPTGAAPANCRPGMVAIDPNTGTMVKCPAAIDENTVRADARKYAAKGFGDDNIISVDLIEQIDGEDKGGYLMTVAYRAKENLTVKMTRQGVVMDIRDFLKHAVEKPGLGKVRIFFFRPHMNLVDKYGQTKEEQVGKVVIRRAVLDKINWDNITIENFENILASEGQFWIHPALNK